MLDRIGGEPPVVQYLVDSLEALGYSWAHRTLNTAGACLQCVPEAVLHCHAAQGVETPASETPGCKPRAGFGVPNRRRRVFLLASLHGDPRDVLLTQVPGQACLFLLAVQPPCCSCWMSADDASNAAVQGAAVCDGACMQLHGRPCYLCHQPGEHSTYALDLSNGQCAHMQTLTGAAGTGCRVAGCADAPAALLAGARPPRTWCQPSSAAASASASCCRPTPRRTAPGPATCARRMPSGCRCMHMTPACLCTAHWWAHAQQQDMHCQPGHVLGEQRPRIASWAPRVACEGTPWDKSGARLQGLPEACTRESYPVAAPGNAPCPDVRDRDLDKREVRRLCHPVCCPPLMHACTPCSACMPGGLLALPGPACESRRSAEPTLLAAQSQRWALLGNAVSVPVARWLGERLAAPHSDKYWRGPRERKMKPAPLPGGTPVLSPLVGLLHLASGALEAAAAPLVTGMRNAAAADVHACLRACAAPADAGPWYDVYSSDDEGVPEGERYSYRKPGASRFTEGDCMPGEDWRKSAGLCRGLCTDAVCGSMHRASGCWSGGGEP